MNTDESMIYSHIESSGREGIWSKTIRARTNLHQTIVQRCLKNLENQRYIKVVKSVKVSNLLESRKHEYILIFFLSVSNQENLHVV